MLYKFIPQLDFVYEQHLGKWYRTLRWRYWLFNSCLL
jgi:hypothetical protein